MIKIKFLAVEGGMHGGMTFTPKVHVYRFSPTERNPRRYEKWFTVPSMRDATFELDKRCNRLNDCWLNCGDARTRG